MAMNEQQDEWDEQPLEDLIKAFSAREEKWYAVGIERNTYCVEIGAGSKFKINLVSPDRMTVTNWKGVIIADYEADNRIKNLYETVKERMTDPEVFERSIRELKQRLKRGF